MKIHWKQGRGQASEWYTEMVMRGGYMYTNDLVEYMMMMTPRNKTLYNKNQIIEQESGGYFIYCGLMAEKFGGNQ